MDYWLALRSSSTTQLAPSWLYFHPHQGYVASSLLTLGMLPGKSFLQIQKLAKFKHESVISLCQHLMCNLHAQDKKHRKKQVCYRASCRCFLWGKRKYTLGFFPLTSLNIPLGYVKGRQHLSHFSLLLQLAKQSLVFESQNSQLILPWHVILPLLKIYIGGGKLRFPRSKAIQTLANKSAFSNHMN